MAKTTTTNVVILACAMSLLQLTARGNDFEKGILAGIYGTYEEANEDCKTRYAKYNSPGLALVADASFNQELSDYMFEMGVPNAFIALRKEKREDYQWPGNVSIDYSNFKLGAGVAQRPERCVIVANFAARRRLRTPLDGQWVDVNCDSAHASFCQMGPYVKEEDEGQVAAGQDEADAVSSLLSYRTGHLMCLLSSFALVAMVLACLVWSNYTNKAARKYATIADADDAVSFGGIA